MGSVKKALKPITRVVDDIIPNEIKPALPYIAATFGAPYLAGTGLFTQGIANVALRKGLAGALANVGTQVALGKNVNPVSAGISGLFAGAGPLLEGKGEFAESVGSLISPDKIGGMTLGEAATAASVPVTAGTAEAAYDAAREAEDAYDQYLKEQEAAGNEDIQTRVEFITRYLQNAGFDQDYIDTRLNELGYAANGGLMGTRVGFKTGGRVGFKEGGGDFDFKQALSQMFDAIREAQATQAGILRDEEEKEKEIEEAIRQLDLFRDEKAKGGIMATRVGFKDGGYTPTDYYDQLMYEDYLQKLEEGLVPMDETTGKPMSYEDYEQDRAESMMKKGGRVGFKDGGYDPGIGTREQYKEYLSDLENDIISPDTTFNEWVDDNAPDPDMDATYRSGGRVGFEEGGSSSIEQQKRENYFDLKRDEFMSMSEYLESGLSDTDLRSGAAEGGIMNLKVGGKPAEMDLRKGGFVPIGAKEKADDVPARLSKNEFVMTADAVRAAGGGSVNKGAKKMYDLMNKLEARV
jgi:hypothetical protein